MIDTADGVKATADSVCSDDSWDCVDCVDDSLSERSAPACEAPGHTAEASPSRDAQASVATADHEAAPVCQSAPSATWRTCVAQAVPSCLRGSAPACGPRGRRLGGMLTYVATFVRRHAVGLLAGAVVTLGCVVAVQQQRIKWLRGAAAAAADDAESAAANAARLEKVAHSLYESYKSASGEARGAQAQLRRAQALMDDMQAQYHAAFGRPLTCLASIFGWRTRRHVWFD